jgi:adenylate kinase
MFTCPNWRLFLEENSVRAVIVGIPGVGKTTVITEVRSNLQRRGLKSATAVFGTLMFEEAKKTLVKNRDEMRNLSIAVQKNLQEEAAKKISKMNEGFIIIDTHLFIKSSEWFYPGVPMNVIQIIKPTHLLLIIADANEITSRRQKDDTRHRDLLSKEGIQQEIDLSKMMIASLANLTGSPFAIIENNNNEAAKAAENIAKILVENR